MEILPIRGRVSTTVWLHHLDSHETLREKPRYELHKFAAVYFE